MDHVAEKKKDCLNVSKSTLFHKELISFKSNPIFPTAHAVR